MDSHLRLTLLAARQQYLVTWADVQRCGISGRQWDGLIQEGLWTRVTPVHFRPVAVPLSFGMQVHAGSRWLGRRSALFGSSALSWLGVEIEQPTEAAFLVPRGRRSIVPWVDLHTTTKWDESDFVWHRGVRTTNATRAILDHASTGPSARELEAAIDSAVRLRRTALSRLRARLADLSGPGRHGVPLLRELLLDSGGESYLERRFLRLVRHAGLRRPSTQVTMRIANSRVRVDFHFGPVIVEVSGRLGHTSDRDRQRDARRRNDLQRQGFLVLEFTTSDVIDDPAHVVRTLRSALSVTT